MVGEQHERGVAMAVAEINAAGGLLGQSVEVVVADDYCEAEQGVAAARKLIAAGIVFVPATSARAPPSRPLRCTRTPASS